MVIIEKEKTKCLKLATRSASVKTSYLARLLLERAKWQKHLQALHMAQKSSAFIQTANCLTFGHKAKLIRGHGDAYNRQLPARKNGHVSRTTAGNFTGQKNPIYWNPDLDRV